MGDSWEISILKSYDNSLSLLSTLRELSYLGSTLYNTLMDFIQYQLKRMFCQDLDCNLEHKDQCLHGSWHTVPSTKYKFAE